MLSFETLIAIALAYLLALFCIAYWGDKTKQWQTSKPVVYSLGLGVYCTSWAFFGVTGQTAQTGWWLTPTFVGAILIYVFVWPLVLKVASICKQFQITSLADFIATRYGQSAKLAALITCVSVVAVVPYIALQLRAITNSFNVLTAANPSGFSFLDNSLMFTLVLAAFAILFGTRRVRSSEHNPGLMFAIAFESIVKLVTFLLIGLFVCFVMFDGVADVFSQAKSSQLNQQLQHHPAYVYWVQALLGALMMLCLPRQFHMCFIENNTKNELNTSRWLFPLYMIGLNLFALPVAYAGMMLLGSENVVADSFMLRLPMLAESASLSALSFLGGFSAASSMVIVASIVLSIMVSNDLITPWMVKREFNLTQKQKLNPQHILAIRRGTILLVLLLAYLYHKITQNVGLLANTGLMAMTLLAQFAPALLLGLYWRQANHRAAYRSIIVGGLLWAYTLFIPTILLATQPEHSLLQQGLFGLSYLRPTALFNVEMEFISHGVLFSLGANVLVFVYYSLASSPSVSEQLQASQYLQRQSEAVRPVSDGNLSIEDIAGLMTRFVSREQVEKQIEGVLADKKVNRHAPAPPELERLAERELSAIIGGASARLIIDSAKRYRHDLLNDVVDLVDEASEVLKFNRSLLQSTIQNIGQGISVVDKELRLVAWNRRYLEMFDYPEEEIFIGRPVQEIIQFNAQRGLFGGNKLEEAVTKRIGYLKAGKPYRYQRVHANGTVIEINGNPLPGGGFVTTYTDITEFVDTQKALEEVNLHLEQRVKQRTQDLTDVNQRLEEAREQAEQANIDKTRYFAAVSHDLLQPFNAATLFSSILLEKVQNPEIRELSQNIHNSLNNAEQLLASVLELTKLDAGAVQVQPEEFSLEELLQPLVEEFAIIFREKGLAFHHSIMPIGVRSDRKLLRRVLQNLLSNAARYTNQGKVELKVSLVDQEVSISVSDTGTGIRPEDQQRIFNDFEQLDNAVSGKGLGLGLAVASRICRILGHRLSLDSKYAKGSTFSLYLPLVKLSSQKQKPKDVPSINKRDLVDVTILVLDNDRQVLTAMRQRLQEWGCKVDTAENEQELTDIIAKQTVDLIIADYHLDNGVTGIDLVQKLFENNERVPVIVNSADHSLDIRERAIEAGFGFMTKPVKPAALKRLIKRHVRLNTN